MARGCLLLEEEEEGRGGRREEVQARSRSGAVVMMGPCETNQPSHGTADEELRKLRKIRVQEIQAW